MPLVQDYIHTVPARLETVKKCNGSYNLASARTVPEKLNIVGHLTVTKSLQSLQEFDVEEMCLQGEPEKVPTFENS